MQLKRLLAFFCTCVNECDIRSGEMLSWQNTPFNSFTSINDEEEKEGVDKILLIFFHSFEIV